MRNRTAIQRLLTATGLAGAALVFGPLVADAILVAPHAVFIDHRQRSSQVFLINTGTVPEEVAIELRYGYPDSDSLGDAYITWPDTSDPTQRSAAGWVRAFPRRTVVQPGERQAVRLLAQPPLGLEDGEYWSRLIVTSRESRPPVVSDTTVRTGISVEIRTILSLTYRKGPVRTSVTMTEFQPMLERDSVIVWMGLHRDGNAAFLGSVDVSLRDPQGRERGTWNTPVAVYYHVRRRFAFPIEGDSLTPGGPYAVTVRVSTARDDLSSDNILPAPPLRDSALVVLR